MYSDTTTPTMKTAQSRSVLLQRADVRVDIRDYLCRTRMAYHFLNAESVNIEAVYTFPLPIDGVLTDLRVQIGERELRGAAVEKSQAQEDYEQAVSEGDADAALVGGPGEWTLVGTDSVDNTLAGLIGSTVSADALESNAAAAGTTVTDLTAGENVALPLRTHTKLPAPVIERLVLMKLHAVGLRTAVDLYPRELSGGMARRVALARALALDPPLMVYDEPLTGLDPIASGVIMSLISNLNATLGLTSIVVSHHVRDTLPIADQVLVTANRTIVFAGTPAELEASEDPLLRQFLRGEPDGPIAFDPASAHQAPRAAAGAR